MAILLKKLDELKDLIVDKSLSEQKEIIVNFFYENRKINKHLKILYKATKDIFENTSLSNFYIQEFINKTFISFEVMYFYSTYDPCVGKNWITEEFETFTVFKEEIENLIWDDLRIECNICYNPFTIKDKVRLVIVGAVINNKTSKIYKCNKCGNIQKFKDKKK